MDIDNHFICSLLDKDFCAVQNKKKKKKKKKKNNSRSNMIFLTSFQEPNFYVFLF